MSDPHSNMASAANAVRRSLADFARFMRGLREDHGVSASKLSALGMLHRAARPLTATELARREGLQPQSVTRIIAELEAKALIARRQNEADRRQVDIVVTAAGADLLASDARRQNAWLADALTERLTPAERAILLLAAELLDRLITEVPRRPKDGGNGHTAGKPRTAHAAADDRRE